MNNTNNKSNNSFHCNNKLRNHNKNFVIVLNIRTYMHRLGVVSFKVCLKLFVEVEILMFLSK